MSFLKKAVTVFFLLVIVFLPLPSGFGGLQQQVTEFIFLTPVSFLQELLFTDSFSTAFSSDTRSLNILLVLSAVIAIVCAVFIRGDERKLTLWGRIAVVYYLAFILLKYGADKIFLAQFYVPGANILYTPFGQLSKDILYWSTMGISPAYSVITGAIEVVAALLLLFRRTRVPGLLLAVMALFQIVIINLSFDISVKTFSLLLLAMALYGLMPALGPLYRMLVLQKEAKLRAETSLRVRPHIRLGVKVFAVGLMVLQAVYPYLSQTGSGSVLAGAYEVTEVSEAGKPLALHQFPVKRIFILEKGYIIFQHHDDSMKDYYLKTNSPEGILVMQDYNGNKRQFRYEFTNSLLTIYLDKGRDVVVRANKLDVDALPALQDEFHFTIDALKHAD